MNAPTMNLRRATVFTSPDGIEWTRMRDSPALVHGEILGVVRGQRGYVAVDAVLADPSRGDSGLRAAAWTSPGGRTWTLMAAQPGFDISLQGPEEGPTDVVLHGIAVHGDRMVALGEVTRYGAASAAVSSRSVAWWSDGEAWLPVVIDQHVGPLPMTISGVPSGFLAHGWRHPHLRCWCLELAGRPLLVVHRQRPRV
jgi:hypothetical protein